MEPKENFEAQEVVTERHDGDNRHLPFAVTSLLWACALYPDPVETLCAVNGITENNNQNEQE